MEATIPVEAVKLMALCNETDLYNYYVPFCTRSYPIKTINKCTKVAASEMHFPIIPNREVLFVGEGIDRLS